MMNINSPTIAETLREGKSTATYTIGVSMKPLLYEGRTHVILVPAEHPLKRGDLPIYLRSDGKYVIHRVIRVFDDYYYTRGDNCISGEKIPRDWVLGKVVAIYRNGRKIKTTDLGYRVYVGFWNLIFPIRYVLGQLKKVVSRHLVKAEKNKP